MEYHGAVEYFFWLGVEDAQIDPQSDITGYVDSLVLQGSKIAIDCAEAFVLGFELGLVLSEADYVEMINPAKIDVTEEIYEEVDDFAISTDINGNC